MLSLFVVASPLNFHLEQYDGPLDLLLDLIRKQEINIYDIPIARITQQYLEYMQKAAEMDIELRPSFTLNRACCCRAILSSTSFFRKTIRGRSWSIACSSTSASRMPR